MVLKLTPEIPVTNSVEEMQIIGSFNSPAIARANVVLPRILQYVGQFIGYCYQQ